MNLFYDFETTGLPDFKKPSRADHQPHIVQLAAILADPETGDVISSVDLIVRPNGWEIPTEASDIHGITTEKAMKVGVDEDTIVALLMAFSEYADLRIAHNESFDARIMRIALFRFYGVMPEAREKWKAKKVFCTCNAASPLTKLPPTDRMMAAGRRGFKRPNLTEAYFAATGKTLEDAHSAMPDVLACKAVYEWVLSHG